MYRLYCAGKSPAEIAKLCAEGTAGTAPFQIPRRTVHDIVRRMADEAEQKLPTSVAEVEGAEAVDRFPVRIARIVDAEITRLERKQEKVGLSCDDYDRLRKAAALSRDLARRLSQRKPSEPQRRRGTGKGTGTQAEPESAIEKLARELAEEKSGEDHPSSTHPRPDDPDQPASQPPHGPSEAPQDASRPPITARPATETASAAAETAETSSDPPTAAIRAAMARKTPAERAKRAQEARRARAVLASRD